MPDLFKLQLSYDAPTGGGTAQYNGNISTMQWRSYVNTTCLAQQQYRFAYDAANRLTAADHYTNSSGSWTFTNNYTESNITYDLNGNLKTYTRRGLTSGTSTFGNIDQLTYFFDDAARPDRLTRVTDVASATKGFKYLTSATSPHYLYDSNGNLTQDKHKDLFFAYNHLNLPNSINNSADAYITLTYTADGEKLTKVAGGVTKNYVAGIEYSGVNLEAIYHAEGRCTPNGATAFYYEYTLKDHLGNARVNWRANGTSVTFLEELHYYSFGMLMEGIGTTAVTTNGYKYNSKELNADLALNWYDYGARWYDPAVGRWWSVDPLAEKYNTLSAYNFALNNPVIFVDPDGMGVRITITGEGENMKVKVSATIYVYAEEGTGIDADSYASKMQQELDDNYNNGFCSGKGNSDVTFDFKVVSVKNYAGAKSKYEELTTKIHKSGYAQKNGKELDYDQNFILLNNNIPNENEGFGRAFGNFGTVSVNVPNQLSHEMGHIMGYGYLNNEGEFKTHTNDSNSGIMSGNPNRTVTQQDIDRLNFGYGLTNKPGKQHDAGQLSQDFTEKGVKYVGNSSAGIIKLPFRTSNDAIKAIDKIK